MRVLPAAIPSIPAARRCLRRWMAGVAGRMEAVRWANGRYCSAGLAPTPTRRLSIRRLKIHSLSIRRLKIWRRALLASLFAAPLTFIASPLHAADRVLVSLGPFERSISVEALRIYAEEGRFTENLRAYANSYATEAQLQQIEQLLKARLELNLSPWAVSQFLYSDQGDLLLQRLGEVVRTGSNLSGKQALRSALVLAAADGENGLTPLNVLEHFPVDTVRIDLTRAFAIISSVEQLVNQTKQAIDAIALISQDNARLEPLPSTAQVDPRWTGRYTVSLQALKSDQFRGCLDADAKWSDLQRSSFRNRPLEVDLYLPVVDAQNTLPDTMPLVVVSHGLGSNRLTFSYIARHLASHGFAVAVPEHPGSNTERLEDLIDGIVRNETEPAEFVQRPQDITCLLNTLEREPRFANLIDTQRVGVVGQSLGGYTAMAIAGAPLNLARLNRECKLDETLNLSLLLQCRLQNWVLDANNLRDPRVKAIVAINTLGSSLFGEDGYAALDVPTLIVASGADTVTPALPEQITPFTWLTTPDRYLLLLQNATHFSAIDVPAEDNVAVNLPPEVVGPNPAIAHYYIRTTSLAFFQTHLNRNAAYRLFLSARYIQQIQDDQLPLSIVEQFTPDQLAQSHTKRQQPNASSQTQFIPR
jgi:predicted dienelactone hydrolase